MASTHAGHSSDEEVLGEGDAPSALVEQDREGEAAAMLVSVHMKSWHSRGAEIEGDAPFEIIGYIDPKGDSQKTNYVARIISFGSFPLAYRTVLRCCRSSDRLEIS